MKQVDVVIVGGGPAGLSASIALKELGVNDILLVEQSHIFGGVLNQCIHNGFGLHLFKEELTGPEYAHRLEVRMKELKVPYLLNTMVSELTPDKKITLFNEEGAHEIQAKAIILAMGCRERPKGAINIPGTRPAGIYSAGTAQELVNLKGYRVGNKAVIVGSGDIGLVMARRLVLEGTEVAAVVEIMPYSSGLRRNIVQCLDDFDIPLYYSTTVSRIFGTDRITGINIAQVDENKQIIKESERFLECDTLLFSVGLIPENDLSVAAGVELDSVTGGPIVNSDYLTNVEGIFACGNVLHVHDLVDNVSLEAEEAALAVKNYLDAAQRQNHIPVEFKEEFRYVVPHFLNQASVPKDTQFKFRIRNVFENATVALYVDGEQVHRRKFRILTPGELEIVKVPKKAMEIAHQGKKIELRLEEEG